MVNQSGSWYVTFCNVLDPSTDSRASQAPAGFDSAPPPAYQMAIQGSRYGFRPSDPEKQHGPDGNTFPASWDRGTAPSSHVSVTPSSRKVPIIPVSRDAPMFRGGSITRGISPAPSFRGGSITPSSRRGSTAPNSRGGSTAPNSHGGSTAPNSRGGSTAPNSRRGSTLPSSRSGSIPMSRNTSAVMAPGSQKGSLPATGSLSRSQSRYSSGGASTRIVTQQPHVYPDEPLPSPPCLTPTIEYSSDEEESQLPDDEYYRRLARKRARANGNDFTFEMTQFPHPSGDVVSVHHFVAPFLRVLSLVNFLLSRIAISMKTLEQLRT